MSLWSRIGARDMNRHLREDRVAGAARVLVRLPGIGISRASKVLALSNQDELGIYDSRSAHGLSDLCDAGGCPIIAIPPGRVIRGHAKSPNGFCAAFQEYTCVLRYLRDRAKADKILAHFGPGAKLSHQLGDGTRAARSIPVRSAPGNDWKQAAIWVVTASP